MPIIRMVGSRGHEPDPVGQGPSAQTAVNIAVSPAYQELGL